jgi:hypothetical protein
MPVKYQKVLLNFCTSNISKKSFYIFVPVKYQKVLLNFCTGWLNELDSWII